MTDFDPGPRWRPEPDPGRVEHELDPRDVADAYDLLDGEAFYDLDDDDPNNWTDEPPDRHYQGPR